MWYLIVSIPDLCNLITLGNKAEQQGVQRERRVKGTRRQNSSRGNKIKNSKVEQEDRAAAGIIRERRLKGNKKTEQQQE